MKKKCWMGMILCGIILSLGAENINLIQGTMPEAGSSGKCPKGWSIGKPEEIIRITNDMPPGVAGEKSIQLDYKVKGKRTSNWCLFTSGVTIDPQKSYRFSVWLKTDGLFNGFGATAGYYFYNRENKLIGGSSYPYDPNMRSVFLHQGPREWKYFSYGLVPGSTPKDGKYGKNEIPPDTVRIVFVLGAVNYPGVVNFTFPVLEELNANSSEAIPGDEKITSSVQIIEPVDIDGQFNEKVWQQKNDWENKFFRTVCNLNETEIFEGLTEFKTGQDLNYFYLAIICRQPSEQITALADFENVDAIWSDDYLDIFIDPSGMRDKRMFQIAINPNNTIQVFWSGKKTETGTKSAVVRTDDGWQVELAIPRKKMIQLLYESGITFNSQMWSLNVARHYRKGGLKRYSSWSYTGKNGFKQSEFMGTMLLTSPQNALADRWQAGIATIEQLKSENAKLLQVNQDDSNQNRQLKQNIMMKFKFYQENLEKIQKWKNIDYADFALSSRRNINLLYDLSNEIKLLRRRSFTVPVQAKPYGFISYRVPLLTPMSIDLVPEQQDLSEKFELLGAKHSSASLEIGLFPFQKLNDMEFIVGEFISEDGRRLSENAADLRIVRKFCTNTNVADVLMTNTAIPLTGRLQNYATHPRKINIATEFETILLYLKINTREAGTFHGKITVKSQNCPDKTIKIKLTVLPFELEPSDKTYGFFYLGVLDKTMTDHNSSPMIHGNTTPETMLLEMQKLYAAGCRLITLYCYSGGPLNTEYCKEVMTLAAKAGFKEVILLGGEHIITAAKGVTETENAEFAKRAKIFTDKMKVILADAEELGIKKIYVYTVDEALSEPQLRRLTDFSGLVHQVGAKTACALIFEQARQVAADKTDLLMMAWSILAGEGYRSDFNQAVNRGEKTVHERVIYYPILGNTPNIARMAFGWYLYKSRYEGCFPWAYYEFANKGNPNFDTIRYVIQTADEPIPTLMYEAAIEGIIDMRFIKTVEKAIAIAKNSPEVAKAEKILADLTAQIELCNDSGANGRRSPAEYEIIRNGLIQILTDLNYQN